MPYSAGSKILQGGNLPMNEFLIDCSFKQYRMALKFDLLIQRYAILIPRYAA
jgi:hypothetical protein